MKAKILILVIFLIGCESKEILLTEKTLEEYNGELKSMNSIIINSLQEDRYDFVFRKRLQARETKINKLNNLFYRFTDYISYLKENEEDETVQKLNYDFHRLIDSVKNTILDTTNKYLLGKMGSQYETIELLGIVNKFDTIVSEDHLKKFDKKSKFLYLQNIVLRYQYNLLLFFQSEIFHRGCYYEEPFYDAFLEYNVYEPNALIKVTAICWYRNRLNSYFIINGKELHNEYPYVTTFITSPKKPGKYYIDVTNYYEDYNDSLIQNTKRLEYHVFGKDFFVKK